MKLRDQLVGAYKHGDSHALRRIAQQINQLRFKTDQMTAGLPQGSGQITAPAASQVVLAQTPAPVVRKVVRPVTDDEKAMARLAADKASAEVELLRIDLELKRAQLVQLQQEQYLAAQRAQVLQSDMENRAIMAQIAGALNEAMNGVTVASQQFTQTAKGLQESVQDLAKSQSQTAAKAAEVLEKPRRIVRENGRIVGIEVINGGR